jgi:hypothetical protein
MKKIKELKMQVTPEQSEIVQRRMIEQMKMGGNPELIHFEYLYIYKDRILFGETMRVFYSHWLPELTFDQWQADQERSRKEGR